MARRRKERSRNQLYDEQSTFGLRHSPVLVCVAVRDPPRFSPCAASGKTSGEILLPERLESSPTLFRSPMLKHGTVMRRRLVQYTTARHYGTGTRKPDQLRHPAFQDLEERLSPLPCFRTRAEHCVKVLYEPREFYQSLLVSLSTFNIRPFLFVTHVLARTGQDQECKEENIHSIPLRRKGGN